ncbi:MAG: plasmid mobilization relaxosome protein MobC [Cyanobacteriota bacterium]|nr:plasmid mobilization relaxosome protein MobC [Cyanobacteriota bacterium]
MSENRKRDWKTAKRKRSASLSIRLTPEERAQLDEDAARLGITTGAYVRQVLLDAPVPKQSRRLVANDNIAILGKYIGELGKIGSNLNQLAHAANYAKAIGHFAAMPSAELVIATCEDARAWVQKLYKILHQHKTQT